METIAQNKKEQESKHFTSLQIFTSHAEPALDEYLPRKDQQFLEQKQRDEEDKLYRYIHTYLYFAYVYNWRIFVWA